VNDTDPQHSRVRHLAYGNAETLPAPSWRVGSAGQSERTVAVVLADAGLDRALVGETALGQQPFDGRVRPTSPMSNPRRPHQRAEGVLCIHDAGAYAGIPESRCSRHYQEVKRELTNSRAIIQAFAQATPDCSCHYLKTCPSCCSSTSKSTMRLYCSLSV